MKPCTFSIRGREYKAAPDPESPDTVTVTGQVRGKGGNLLPNIVPLIATELIDAGFPASPWGSYWRGLDEDGLQFIASQTQAWAMVSAAFQEVKEADEICVDCHASAARMARRAGLAEACGIIVPNHAYWLFMRRINDRFITRLKELWAEFESPLKDLFGNPDRFFVFPVAAYPKSGSKSDLVPQPGDLEWVVGLLGGVAKGLGYVFNSRILLEITVTDSAGCVQVSSGYGYPPE